MKTKPKIYLACWIDEKGLVHVTHDYSKDVTTNQLALMFHFIQQYFDKIKKDDFEKSLVQIENEV